ARLQEPRAPVPLWESLPGGSLGAAGGQPPGGQSPGTAAGMVGVIGPVLAGAPAGLVAIAGSSHSLAAALISGVLVSLAAMAVLMRFQERAYRRAQTSGLPADLHSGCAPMVYASPPARGH